MLPIVLQLPKMCTTLLNATSLIKMTMYISKYRVYFISKKKCIKEKAAQNINYNHKTKGSMKIPVYLDVEPSSPRT